MRVVSSLPSQTILGDSVVLASIDATIASRFCSVLTSEWLPGKTMGACLYRGSVDGMTAAVFHGRCDGRGPTLTLIRADECGQVCVFGGFTSTSWTSVAMYLRCADAFLFSVAGPHCTVTQFPIKEDKSVRALECNAAWGPRFGTGPDIVLKSFRLRAIDAFDRTSHCGGFGSQWLGGYTDTVGVGKRTFTGTGDGCFTPVDIEVYAVV